MKQNIALFVAIIIMGLNVVVVSANSDNLYVSFPEPVEDQDTPFVEFAHGYVSLANTFGITQPSDGWDWGGTYGFDSSQTNYLGVIDGKITFSWMGTNNRNNCLDYDCSASYGIDVTITEKMYSQIEKGGKALLSFDYDWDDYRNYFEENDELWVKARWTSPRSGEHYLGTELSSVDDDASLEIAVASNPNMDISNSFEQDISEWIESPGTYYLDFGGKLSASFFNEMGKLSFDNIQIKINKKDIPRIYYYKENQYIY